MASIRFSIVDVFSTIAFKGNPLAVVDDMSASLTDTQMKLIARQFNLSETTFVSPPTAPKAAFRLRSFLPNGEEVFGQGHNSLGAWWWLAHHGFLKDREGGSLRQTYYQQMGQEVLPLEVTQPSSKSEAISITLRQGPPQFLAKHANKDALAKALGISSSDIGFEYSGKSLQEAQVVTTSPARHLLIPVSNEEVLSRVSFTDTEALSRQLASTDSGAYVYTPTTKTLPSSMLAVPKFQARFFSPGMSGEDPATGTAAGPLAANLYANGLLEVSPGQSAKVAVLQGLKVGRECLMELDLENSQNSEGESVKVTISGNGVEVASGSLVVPGLDTNF